MVKPCNFKNKKNRNNKTHLVFDETKRREFLTGFRKRKLQRKKKAKEEFEKQLKEERKRLKIEAKESYKNLVQSYKPIPEIEHLLLNEYEEDDVTVKVFELSATEIAEKNNWIGPNHVKYESNFEDTDKIANLSELEEEIPGMELKPKKNSKPKVTTIKQDFKSEKDLKKALKREATKNIKNSKVFQRKGKIEKVKQIKKARREKRLKIKAKEKQSKTKNKR